MLEDEADEAESTKSQKKEEVTKVTADKTQMNTTRNLGKTLIKNINKNVAAEGQFIFIIRNVIFNLFLF